MIRAAAAALAAALLAVPGGAHAETPPAAALAALQALDARVQTIGWRLARGNARFCRETAPGIGLQLLDVAGFGDPAGVRRTLGLASDIAVAAVAAEAPAARAGLGSNRSLSEVAGQPVAALPAARPGDYARLAALHDRIDAALRAQGRVSLTPAGADRLEIAGEPVCATRFELLTGGNRAAADGRRVVVSRKLVEFLRDDELFAALLAHELAHNVLQHRARLDREGRGFVKVRRTEREADRLSLWLLANAGYDPQAGLRFMAIWGPPNDKGIFSSPDHDRWKTRLRKMTAELAVLRAAMARRGGVADWAQDFVAEP